MHNIIIIMHYGCINNKCTHVSIMYRRWFMVFAEITSTIIQYNRPFPCMLRNSKVVRISQMYIDLPSKDIFSDDKILSQMFILHCLA